MAKKYITLFIVLLGVIWLSYGQKSITRFTPDTETKAYEYIARDYVRFTDGYRFTAAQNKTLHAAIDEHIIVPTNYHLENPPTTNRTLSTSCAVGSLPGVLDVSPTGAATYTIPIEVAQGVMGVQPNIALVYNSQAGNGLVGWGFGISGLSAITRVPKNIYSDGAAFGMKNNLNDSYALDGNRLIQFGPGTYGMDGTEYRTEIETFARIISKGNYILSNPPVSTGPDWFEVMAKDGTVYRYGSNSGKLEYEKNIVGSLYKRSVQSWQLDYVESLNGQTIIYEYENTDLCSYIKKITYGNNSVEFFYETRSSDVIPVHFDRKKDSADRILYRVVCRQAGSIFREYKLEYKKDYTYSYLVKITESNGNDEAYNPTVFEWGASAESTLKVTDVSVTGNNFFYGFDVQSFFSADLNGDGLTDLIGVTESNEVRYYVASKGNNGNIQFTFGDTCQLAGNRDLPKAKDIAAGRSVFDFWGRGRQDLLFVGYDESNLPNNKWKKVRFDVVSCINNNNIIHQTFGRDLSISSRAPAYTVGDLNNDGKTEIIYVERPNDMPPFPVLDYFPGEIIISGTNGAPSYEVPFSITTGSGVPEELFVADFDGDGLNDLFVLTKGGYVIYFNNGGTFGDMFSEDNKISSTDFNGDYHDYSRIKIGDFNGDGLPDFLLNEAYNANWHIALNNGNGTFTITPCPGLTALGFVDEEFTIKNIDKDECFVIDFNGDGKSDIVINDAIYRKKSDISSTWGEFVSHRTFFLNSSIWENDFSSAMSIALNDQSILKKHFAFGDFNGDGMMDVLVYGYTAADETNQKWRLYTNQHYTTQSGKITKIADGLNNEVALEYTALTDETVYQKQTGGSVNYPVIQTQAPLSVVKKVSFDSGPNTSDSVSYNYKGAKVHLAGKGFLGFSEITAINTVLDRKTTTEYGYDETYFYPYMKKQKITTTSDQAITTTTCTTTCKIISNNPGEKRFIPYISSQTVKDELTGLSVKTEILNMDNNGNPASIKTTKGDLTETQTINYVTKGSWCPNKIENIEVERVLSGGDTQTRKTAYVYNNNGNLTQETIDPDDTNNKVITKYQSFNSHGQPQKIVTTANGESRTLEQTYTTSGRFVKTRKNVLGETTTYDWDESKGVLNSVTDHRSRTTRYRYDNWGQLTSTVYPDGIETVNTLQWADAVSGKPSNAIYCNYAKTTGQSPLWVWYDTKGREVRQDYLGLSGEKIYVRTEYNSQGQLYRISEPNFSSTSATWKTYTYDDYGRVSKITTPAGETSYTSNPPSLLTTVTSPAGTRTIVLNNVGWVASEKVNDKKVDFTYYASGLVKKAAPQDGIAISMEYNKQGNRTKLTDPDAGVITSKYDGWGQLRRTSQLVHIDTQDSIISEYFYHSSGLLNYKTCNGETTNYGYDNLNRLQTISISGQHQQTFTYDADDRITNVKEEFDGKTYNIGTGYDTYGRVKRETYPSGYYTENTYDANGILTEVKDNANRSIWKAVEANAHGQLTRIKNGNSEATFGYDSRGFLTSAFSQGYMNWSYIYDAKGNMTSRKDGIANYRDDMTYDDMNRLTHWCIFQGNTQVQMHSMSYHQTTGNIESKSDLGNLTMKYGERKHPPHALTSISGVPTNFPQADLDVTYTDFKKVKTLSEGDGEKFYELTYGVDQQRRKSVYKENNTVKQTRYYLGDYEEEVNPSGNIRKIHYLRGGGIFIQNNGIDSLLYAYTDHLGSLTILTNQSNFLERFAYDPWGNRRSPHNWTLPDTRPLILNRGFTGHEHIDQFGIINMNGRVYDPLTSQFFSPDPYVQMPGNWLNYNRYAYCWNNPLIYTDPSGEFIFTALSAIFCPVLLPVAIGADLGMWAGGSMANGTMNPFKWDYSSGKTWGHMGGGALIGGLSGGAAAGVSALGGSAWWAGAAAGTVGGAGFSGLATGWDGEAMFNGAWKGALSGFVGGGLGSAIGGGLGALAGGAGSNITSQLLHNNGKVDWTSVAMSAGLSYGMYHATSYISWKWGGGNNIGGRDISYKQFKAMNTAYQRSRFWRREFGVYLNGDGSAKITPWKDTHKYSVEFNTSKGNVNQTMHTHWDTDGYVTINGDVYETFAGRHSPEDMRSFPRFSIVVGRTTSTYYVKGMPTYNYISPDPFIRFFLFPW